MLKKIVLILVLIVLNFNLIYSYQSIPYQSTGFNICYNLSNTNALAITTDCTLLTESTSYKIAASVNWLTNNSCNLNLVGNTVNANWNSSYNSYVNYLQGKTIPQISNLNLGKQILDANLWMNTSVTYLLNYPNGTYTGILDNPTFLVKDGGTNLPQTILNKSYIQTVVNAGYYPPGNYFVVGKVTPIDMKCDFNSPFGSLQPNEAITKIVPTKTFNVFKDTDNDGWDDGVLVGGVKTYILTDKKDLCPGVIGVDKFQGCATEYTKLKCTQNAVFDGINIACNTADWGKRLYYSNINFNRKDIQLVDKGNFDGGYLSIKPSSGSGFYSCYDGPFKEDGWAIGYCNLRYNAQSSCTIGTEKLTQGSAKEFYKYSNILPSERSDKKSISCISKDTFSNQTLVDLGYQYSKPRFLGPRYKNIKRNADGTFSLIGNEKLGKISCPSNSLNCKINIKGIDYPINLRDLNKTTLKSFKIYKQGNFDRIQKIDSKIIALKAHKIKKFRTSNEAINFVSKSVQLMEKFDIVKDLNYNSITNITTVKISTSNFSGGSKIKNLTIYQVIDKSIAQSYDNINFISDGGGQRFVVDKDPIIGWYFNDTSGSTTISYNVSGNNEGGTIIITQEPILFNEGELIINYREGQVGCNNGEVHLFDLNSLDNSAILAKNSGVYQVCITHLDSNINLLSGNLGSNIVNISSYNLGSNISSNFDLLTNKSQLSVNNNGIYWDMRVQRDNPDGNFSCLGSYDKIGGSSLFGDCGFNPDNRIWLHLGADYLAPTTTLTIPHLAHTVSVSLNAVDNIGGSKVNNTFYCAIDNSNSCQNLNTDFTTYLNPFQLNCPSDWSCSRILKYYSDDNAGNVENLTTEELYLIDKGSACQSDCTAKPSPNRYLKECRNLNGCFYKPTPFEIGLDKGRTVANSCNLLVEGSYVDYNQTHQIKCPSGPFKLKKITSQTLNLEGSKCDFLIKNQYPIIYDGNKIMMNIISCDNKIKN